MRLIEASADIVHLWLDVLLPIESRDLDILLDDFDHAFPHRIVVIMAAFLAFHKTHSSTLRCILRELLFLGFDHGEHLAVFRREIVPVLLQVLDYVRDLLRLSRQCCRDVEIEYMMIESSVANYNAVQGLSLYLEETLEAPFRQHDFSINVLIFPSDAMFGPTFFNLDRLFGAAMLFHSIVFVMVDLFWTISAGPSDKSHSSPSVDSLWRLILQDDVASVLKHRLIIANLFYRDRLKDVPMPEPQGFERAGEHFSEGCLGQIPVLCSEEEKVHVVLSGFPNVSVKRHDEPCGDPCAGFLLSRLPEPKDDMTILVLGDIQNAPGG